jgi:hypothetical protein
MRATSLWPFDVAKYKDVNGLKVLHHRRGHDCSISSTCFYLLPIDTDLFFSFPVEMAFPMLPESRKEMWFQSLPGPFLSVFAFSLVRRSPRAKRLLDLSDQMLARLAVGLNLKSQADRCTSLEIATLAEKDPSLAIERMMVRLQRKAIVRNVLESVF